LFSTIIGGQGSLPRLAISRQSGLAAACVCERHAGTTACAAVARSAGGAGIQGVDAALARSMMTGRHLFDLQREVSLWPSRHVVLRIYCLALGAKRTSASWVTRPDLRCVFGQSGSRAPWGVRTYFGSPYWAELVRNLPPTSISKFGSKGTPPPLGYFGTLAQYRRPSGRSRENRWSGHASR
jgi:hypothetical protein